jgi:hypothetical protein
MLPNSKTKICNMHDILFFILISYININHHWVEAKIKENVFQNSFWAEQKIDFS